MQWGWVPFQRNKDTAALATLSLWRRKNPWYIRRKVEKVALQTTEQPQLALKSERKPVQYPGKNDFLFVHCKILADAIPKKRTLRLGYENGWLGKIFYGQFRFFFNSELQVCRKPRMVHWGLPWASRERYEGERIFFVHIFWQKPFWLIFLKVLSSALWIQRHGIEADLTPSTCSFGQSFQK